MKKIIIGCVTILIALNATLAYAQFTDVPEDNEYYYAVSYLESNGTIASNADDLFYPDRDVNRAEFYKMLLTDSGFDPKGQKDTDNQFDDLKGDEWYASYANKAAKIGLIELSGEPDNFYADRPITKGEAVKIMMEWAGIPIPMYIDEGDFDLPYKDTSYTNIYAPYIEMALTIGLMEPYNENYFGTYKKITRAESAQLIYLFDSFAVTDAYLESIADTIRANLEIPFLLVLEDVYTRLTEDYYEGELDGEELMYAAIEGMVNAIGDVNTVYFLPDAAESFTQVLSGNFEGIGVYLQTNEDGTIEIMQVIEGGPAEKAGFLAGDIILEVDEVSTEGLNVEEVANLIKGEVGTEVKIKIYREDSDSSETKAITVTRAEFEVEYISAEIMNRNIIYYDLASFGEFTGIDFEELTTDMLEDYDIKGVIIDLRDNGGGYLTTCVDIMSHFIKEGEEVMTIKTNYEETAYYSEGPADLNDLPLIILVNDNSASASEIMAAVLQEYDQATIVGIQSYGKGSAQDVISYYDGSSLKITTAHWLTPEGKDINGIGVTPDIEIEDTITSDDDEQLEKAVEELKEMME